jgi:beta-galactosidase
MAVFDVPFVNCKNTLRAVTAACEDVSIVNYRQPETEIAVNLGSSCYYQSNRSALTWLPDQPYSKGSWGYIGGKPVHSQSEIHLTADGPLYQTMRDGMEAYRFDVPKGLYEIELLSADISKPQVSSAYLLDRKQQTGTTSPGVSVGRPFTATRRRYVVDNTDGHLLISFDSKFCLSAIKVRKL